MMHLVCTLHIGQMQLQLMKAHLSADDVLRKHAGRGV